MVNIGNDWDELLKEEFSKDYYLQLRKFLVEEYNHNTVYPCADFSICPQHTPSPFCSPILSVLYFSMRLMTLS